MSDRTTQRDDVWQFIEENGSITHRQAEYWLGCCRLSARIGELRKMGRKIKTDMIPVKNRRNKKTAYIARYSKEA